jgi:hypothetical protein
MSRSRILKTKCIFLKRLRKDAAYVFLRGIIGFFCLLHRKTALRVGSLLGRAAQGYRKNGADASLKSVRARLICNVRL